MEQISASRATFPAQRVVLLTDAIRITAALAAPRPRRLTDTLNSGYRFLDLVDAKVESQASSRASVLELRRMQLRKADVTLAYAILHDIRRDDTLHVEKAPHHVLLQTSAYRISGLMYALPDMSPRDTLEAAPPFLPLTRVEVTMTMGGKLSLSLPFASIRTDAIVYMTDGGDDADPSA